MIKKKILLTGATGGLGSSIADKFRDNDYQLILTTSSSEKLNSLKEIYGDKHFYYKLDLSSTDDLENKIKELANDHKDISVLVNNAGITDDGLILRMKLSQWNRVLETNLHSNFIIIKNILSNMVANKYGKIVGISSVVATSGNPGQSNYVASKSGMIGLYKSVAHEVAKRNINVNLVSPGFITTPMTEKLNDQQKQNILEKIPMQKFGEPIDIANLVFFLSENESNYITGQNININGGMLMV